MASSEAWVRVDDSWLPAGCAARPELVVELHPDGQLKRLARLQGTACVLELTLEQGLPRGRLTDHQGSGGTSDWTTHRDGFSESFDAWSDNSKPRAEPFETFVRRAIAQVAGRA